MERRNRLSLSVKRHWNSRSTDGLGTSGLRSLSLVLLSIFLLVFICFRFSRRLRWTNDPDQSRLPQVSRS